jgi:hypothetical protein
MSEQVECSDYGRNNVMIYTQVDSQLYWSSSSTLTKVLRIWDKLKFALTEEMNYQNTYNIYILDGVLMG